jgi:hypothetical protein
MEEVCAVLAAAAQEHDLPLPFFVRLIWQESRFRSDAVSGKGARGIAQFMPGTAVWRGLDDPHDPIVSLRKSADYLRELRLQFGNLGLAAAAYNGGSGRVQTWLEGRGGLPAETRHYVQIVTGNPVERWLEPDDDIPVATARFPADVPCPVLLAAAPAVEPTGRGRRASGVRVAAAGSPAPLLRAKPASPAWMVVLAANFSHARAQAQWAGLQRKISTVLGGRQPIVVNRAVPGRGRARMSQVRIPEADRASAERLCARLRAVGASCLVIRGS